MQLRLQVWLAPKSGHRAGGALTAQVRESAVPELADIDLFRIFYLLFGKWSARKIATAYNMDDVKIMRSHVNCYLKFFQTMSDLLAFHFKTFAEAFPPATISGKSSAFAHEALAANEAKQGDRAELVNKSREEC